jgi:hypothetical protein
MPHFGDSGNGRPLEIMEGFMAYVSTNFMNNPDAPVGKWTCAPGSSLGPFDEVPPVDKTKGSNFCGQCVSFVKKVCPILPATKDWVKGLSVRDN